MPSCKDITELATGYAEGALDPDARSSFEAHLATCPGCRTWVRQLDLAVLAVRSLPPPELPAELRDQLLRRFDAWRAARAAAGAPARAPASTAGARRYAWEALFTLVGMVALLTGFARNPARAWEDWVVASALAAGAMALAALARRLTPRFAVIAVSAALVAAVVRGGEGQIGVAEGLRCLLTEIATAAAVAGAAWLAQRRAPGTATLGVWAVAGALAGDATLQISCGEHTSMAHLVAFHVGGVLVIVAAALAGTRGRPLAA